MCADAVTRVATAIVSSEQALPQRGPAKFDEVIKTLRDSTGPAIVGTAQAILEELGGESNYGRRIAQDLKQARLEHIPEEMRGFYTPDLKLVRQLHELVAGILEKRDERLKGTQTDPMGEMDEESLMAIVSEATAIRIEADPLFREEILLRIYELDSKCYEAVLAHKLTAGAVPLPSQADSPVIRVVPASNEH